VVERPALAGVTTFISSTPLVVGRLSLDQDAAHHASVKRLAVGDEVSLTDGFGLRASGRVAAVTKRALEIDVDDPQLVQRPAAIHLYAPVADRDRMLMLAEKATELGIQSWRPVSFKRSKSVSPRGEGEAFERKVRVRMVNALEQSGGAWLPEMFPQVDVTSLLGLGGTCLALDQGGAPIADARFNTEVHLLVGPEGGMEAQELALLQSAGWNAVSLGSTVLRFETAGIAAIAVARALLR
jgi:16S rRNA (uracil1498-N3)-methyltransferase